MLDPGGSAVGFHLIPPLAETRCVELTRGPDTARLGRAGRERFFATLGLAPEWVGDAPGLVLGRLLCQLVNEAAFAIAEGVGSVEDVDTGMVHGLNYPRGVLAWADHVGLDSVLATIEALYEERREERYRPSPMLTALVLAGRLGRMTGEGFHRYSA